MTFFQGIFVYATPAFVGNKTTDILKAGASHSSKGADFFFAPGKT